MSSERHQQWQGNYRFFRELRRRFPESTAVLENCRHEVGLLPHNVFGICWTPWVADRISEGSDETLVDRLAAMLDEIASTGDEYWREILVLSILGPLRGRGAEVWDVLLARVGPSARAEMDRMGGRAD